MRRSLLLAALLCWSAPAFAQQTSRAPDCRDDQGADRCDAARQAQVRAKFGVPAIEQLDGEGAQVLRAFYVDGYGHDQPMITFQRRRGADIELVVTFPSDDAGKRAELRGPVPLATWQTLVGRAHYFARDLAPAARDDRVICLHSWMVTVETTVAEVGDGPRTIRRKTQGACDGGLAIELAFAMADAAVELLPPCAVLAATQHRNAVTRLAACAQLEGDRIAAAQAMNQLNSNWFRYPLGLETAGAIAYLFHDRAELRWAGEPPVTGAMAAARAWSSRMAKERFWPLRAIGENPDRVRIEGIIEEVPASDDWSRRRRAKTVQIWTRENGFDFRLRSMTTEPFAAPSR